MLSTEIIKSGGLKPLHFALQQSCNRLLLANRPLWDVLMVLGWRRLRRRG